MRLRFTAILSLFLPLFRHSIRGVAPLYEDPSLSRSENPLRCRVFSSFTPAGITRENNTLLHLPILPPSSLLSTCTIIISTSEAGFHQVLPKIKKHNQLLICVVCTCSGHSPTKKGWWTHNNRFLSINQFSWWKLLNI